MSSQMNPLAKGDFKAMLAEFRSVEIQARRPARPGYARSRPRGLVYPTLPLCAM
jgi:hypothetical protein